MINSIGISPDAHGIYTDIIIYSLLSETAIFCVHSLLESITVQKGSVSIVIISGYTAPKEISGSPRIQPSISCIRYGANSSVHVFKIQARISRLANSFFTWLSYLALSFVILINFASYVSVFTGSHPFREDIAKIYCSLNIKISYRRKGGKRNLIFLAPDFFG